MSVGETTETLDGILDIRYIQRNGKKGWTTITGWISLEITDEKREEFTKKIKKNLGTSASYDKETKTLNIQGDHRDHVLKYINEVLEISEEKIKIT